MKPNAPGSDVTEWIVWLSAIAAWLALFLTFWNTHTARRALRIAERQEDRQTRDLKLHLLEAVSTQLREGGRRRLICELQVTNAAQAPNSIVSIDLRLSYRLASGAEAVIKVPYRTPSLVEGDDRRPIFVPAHLNAHAAVSGHVGFEMNADLTDGRPIDRYEIVVNDIHGDQQSWEITVFREVADA